MPALRKPGSSSFAASATALVLVLLLAFACASEPKPAALKVGGTVPRVMLYDQNEQPHRIDESVRVIFFAREMEGGKVIRALLDKEGPKYLDAHRAVYVADISEMPRLIASMVAIPQMRSERPYPTLLDRDGKATASYPSEEGRVTVLVLDKLRVKAIVYRGSVAGLKQVVDPIR